MQRKNAEDISPEYLKTFDAPLKMRSRESVSLRLISRHTDKNASVDVNVFFFSFHDIEGANGA